MAKKQDSVSEWRQRFDSATAAEKAEAYLTKLQAAVAKLGRDIRDLRERVHLAERDVAVEVLRQLTDGAEVDHRQTLDAARPSRAPT